MIFSAENAISSYLKLAPYSEWWTRSQPIRNTAEIQAHIKILPVKHPHLYQKLAQKAIELHLLGLSYAKIGKILGIDPKTVKKATKQNHLPML
ncbi:MAG: hypothetical protein AUJ70_02470 [Candidatus Omnitrophica bacterium CG1_02_40_15]|nr:MAG: hypothetical protein AUJ70_02470 [Candidatus Omnitrophica bacterium CG1_02_40_15]